MRTRIRLDIGTSIGGVVVPRGGPALVESLASSMMRVVAVVGIMPAPAVPFL